jgi:hypothetical protein
MGTEAVVRPSRRNAQNPLLVMDPSLAARATSPSGRGEIGSAARSRCSAGARPVSESPAAIRKSSAVSLVDHDGITGDAC